MKTKRARPGPKMTDPPHVLEVRERLFAKGFGSLKEAAAHGGFAYDSFLRIVRLGIAADPKQSTIDRLKELGIYDLLPKKQPA